MVRLRVCLLIVCCFCAQVRAADEVPLRSISEAQPARSVESRLDKLESTILQNQQLLDLLKEVEALKSEMAKLRGQAEVQTHHLDTLEKRQKDLYVDLDRRLSELSKPALAATPGLTAAPGQPADSAAATTAQASPPPDPMLESKSYEAALNHFKSGNYASAIAGFKGFLKAYPGSTLASNAQYWVGYAYFALKDYKSALAQQQKLLVAYPASPKIPDALLNIASNQIELNDLSSAKKTFEEIINKHPASNAAALATKRLAALK